MADYLTFIERRGPWDPKGERPPPSSLVPGTIRFLKALVCVVVHMALVGRFSALTLESEDYYSLSLWKRWGQWSSIAPGIPLGNVS